MGEQIRSYFNTGVGQFVGFLPSLVSAIIIFVVGYAVSRLVGSLVRRVCMRAGFDNFVNRRLRAKTAAEAPARPASAAAGSAVFWLGMLVTFSLTARALRLYPVSGGIDRILGYVPRVIVAGLIVGVAIAVANVVSDFIRGVSSAWLARGARVVIIGLSIFMALDELGIARNIVTTMFIALVGAAAVAAAIAFGVGNIDNARDYTREAARRRQRAAYTEGQPTASRYPSTEPGPHAPSESSETGPQTH